eukprot:scaffold34905_cov64-Phaeocystis_antarctica.AAC.1
MSAATRRVLRQVLVTRSRSSPRLGSIAHNAKRISSRALVGSERSTSLFVSSRARPHEERNTVWLGPSMRRSYTSVLRPPTVMSLSRSAKTSTPWWLDLR